MTPGFSSGGRLMDLRDRITVALWLVAAALSGALALAIDAVLAR